MTPGNGPRKKKQTATDAPEVFGDSAVLGHVGAVLVDVIPLASYSLHVSLKVPDTFGDQSEPDPRRTSGLSFVWRLH